MLKTETLKRKVILVIAVMLLLTGCGDKKDGEEVLAEADDEISSENEYGEFQWPKSDIAKLVPIPKSNIGEISWEASYGFVIYVAETPKEDYDSYVDECWDSGFTVDYNKGDDYFWADNEEGYHLYVRYEDDSVMFIRVDEPDGESNTDNKSNTESKVESSERAVVEPEKIIEDEEVVSDEKNDDVSPEFKEAMDSYEAFFDEYCEFMKKYAESEDATSMLGDYANYMLAYTETMQKMEAINEDELSDAETAYYVEVSGRITQKLLEVAN